MTEPQVHVLMATFNGAAHLSAQLQSILEQEYPHWRLLIRDDGSSDGTGGLIRQFVHRDPRILVLDDAEGRLGVCGNFARLSQAALNDGARYVLYCDQDDIWLPHKISRQVSGLKALETRHGESTPVILHTDLQVVAEDLSLVDRSFVRHHGVRRLEGALLPRLIIQNVVTGCALACNRSLLERALPFPEQAVMHDWWLALVAAATGAIAFDPEPSVLYRQHQANAIGASNYWRRLWPDLSRWREHRRRSTREFQASLAQAGALLERCGTIGSRPGTTHLLGAYLDAMHGTRLLRPLAAMRLGVYPQGLASASLQLAGLLTMDPYPPGPAEQGP